jgi:hypothetical protein
MQKQRRDFLKITAAGAAGLALARADRAFAAWPATGTLAVNPTISNMRVVGCYDTKMMKTTPTAMTFAAQNTAIDTARLQANMDAMAMQLANQTTADAAWKAIFTSGKAWNATKVAIKVNSLETKNMAHVAIVQKFCTILAGYGVLPANIIIYDGQSAYTGTSLYTSYFSLTDTTKTPAVVSNLNGSLGGAVKVTIPGGASTNCTANISNGTIDILINIANNKGHDLMGGATLCMKNHFGTFTPTHDINYLFNINKSDAILGGTPVRQQLCFVDSLFTNKSQNTGTPELMPCYLTMGVFAPAVDYLTIKKVREEVLGLTHVEATINSYLTTFGYATTDPVWVVVPPAGGATGADAGAGGAGGSSGAGGSGGTSASGGASGGGSSGSAGARSGGSSGSAGAGGGGSSGTGGARNGGTSGSAGAGSGGARATGGASSSGGNGGTGVADSGGANATGGASAAGGETGGGGATSGGGAVGSTGGATTSVASAAGGSTATGGTRAAGGTTVSPAGGSGGSTGTAVASGTHAGGGNSGSGCAVAGIDRKATRWGAMLALGAVVAAKLRRLVSSDDQSS